MIQNFVTLPDGSIIRPAAVVAVRVREANALAYLGPVGKPRVRVDYVVGDKGQSAILYCENTQERDALAASIRAQVWDEPLAQPLPMDTDIPRQP